MRATEGGGLVGFNGSVPGAARLHLVDEVVLLRPEEQVFMAMLLTDAWDGFDTAINFETLMQKVAYAAMPKFPKVAIQALMPMTPKVDYPALLPKMPKVGIEAIMPKVDLGIFYRQRCPVSPEGPACQGGAPQDLVD